MGAGEQGQAGRFQATLSQNDLDAVSRPLASVLRNQVPAVFEGVAPYDPAVNEILFGSTDVADVSWITPTVRPTGGLLRLRHAPAFVADGVAGPVRPGPRRHGARGARTHGYGDRAGAAARVDRPGQGGAIGAPPGQTLRCPIPADVPLPFLRG